VTAARALDVKPLAAGHAAPREPLPKIAAPASIIAERAPANGKIKVVKVTASGKRQQLVLSVKGAAKSAAQVAAVKSASKSAKAPLQLAMVTRTPEAKSQDGKAATKSATAQSQPKHPVQLAMATRPARR
jgi:hypothetical protein